MEYFANFFCNVALFDAFYQKYHVWTENMLKYNFIAVFLILANFAAFLDHTKEMLT